MYRPYLVFLLLPIVISITAHAQEITEDQLSVCADWLDHDIGQLHSGNTIDLCAETAGKVVLLVNTASYCGYTYQFSGLEALYQRYKDQGLVLVGFLLMISTKKMMMRPKQLKFATLTMVLPFQ